MYFLGTLRTLEKSSTSTYQGRNQDPTQEDQDMSSQNLNKVRKKGVQMLDNYVHDTKNWPHPTSCKKNSMKQEDCFEWSEDMEKDFQEL